MEFYSKKNFLLSNNIFFDRIRVFEDQVFTTKVLFLARNVRFYRKSFHNHLERLNSLGRSMKFSTLMSTLAVIKNMNKILTNQHLNAEQKKFLHKRIKFVFRFFKLNLLLTNDKQSKEVFLFFKNNIKNLFLIDKNLNKKHLLSFKKKSIHKIKNFNYDKFSKIFIFGVGIFGRVICHILKQNKVNIEAFLEGNSYFNNQKYSGIKIINLNKNVKFCFKRPINPLIIVSHLDKKIVSEINNKLKKYGLKRNNIRIINWSAVL